MGGRAGFLAPDWFTAAVQTCTLLTHFLQQCNINSLSIYLVHIS